MGKSKEILGLERRAAAGEIFDYAKDQEELAFARLLPGRMLSAPSPFRRPQSQSPSADDAAEPPLRPRRRPMTRRRAPLTKAKPP